MDSRRDAVVSRLLGAPGLRRLRIVLADGLNVYPHLFKWVEGDSMLRSEDIEIVVPTTAPASPKRRSRRIVGRTLLTISSLLSNGTFLEDLKS